MVDRAAVGDDHDAVFFKRFEMSSLENVFADLDPKPQNDHGGGVACIDYPPTFVIVYDYWRALVAKNEYSLRGLQLSTLCLEHNPANYTVWQYRRDCWRKLLSEEEEHDNTVNTTTTPANSSEQNSNNDNDLDSYSIDKATPCRVDLHLATVLGGTNPKNYQIWHHRRVLLEQLSDQKVWEIYSTNELAYIATVLEVDSKNYHAWSHRQWLVQTISSLSNDDSVWIKELQYTSNLIEKDVRNNSAWNHRWFVLHHSLNDDLNHQFDYCLQQARIDPYNECPWRFLVALLKHHTNETQKDESSLIMQILQETWKIQSDVVLTCGKGPSSSLLSAAIDLLLLQQQQQSSAFDNDDTNASTSPLSVAIATCRKMPDVDPIRTKYWQWRLEQLLAQQSQQ